MQQLFIKKDDSGQVKPPQNQEQEEQCIQGVSPDLIIAANALVSNESGGQAHQRIQMADVNATASRPARPRT